MARIKVGLRRIVLQSQAVPRERLHLAGGPVTGLRGAMMLLPFGGDGQGHVHALEVNTTVQPRQPSHLRS